MISLEDHVASRRENGQSPNNSSFLRKYLSNFETSVSNSMVDSENDLMPGFSTMISRASFYPSLFYNVVMSKFASRHWYDRIDNNVILGALPFRSIAPQLINGENVKGIISMNVDFELRFFVPSEKEWDDMGVKFLQLNTQDLFESPSQDKLRKGVQFIKDYVSTGNTVYVHCKAGRTRSATLVGCYLMEKYKWTPEQAVDYIQNKRPHIWIRQLQWDSLNIYYSENVEQKQQNSASLLYCS